MYSGLEQKNLKDNWPKPVPVAEGPFKVTKAEENTVTIEKTDRYVENAWRSRIVLASKRKTKKGVGKLLLLVKGSKRTETENVNMTDIVSGNDDIEKENEGETKNV